MPGTRQEFCKNLPNEEHMSTISHTGVSSKTPTEVTSFLFFATMESESEKEQDGCFELWYCSIILLLSLEWYLICS